MKQALFVLLVLLLLLIDLSHQLNPPPLTISSPPPTQLSSSASSGFNLILYVQPGAVPSNNNTAFCTVKDSPCTSIQQAINQVLEMYYDRKIIEQPSARFILLPNLSVANSSKRHIYGKDQCESVFNRWFYYLLLESSNEEMIEFQCEGADLVLPEFFYGLYMMRLKLWDVFLRIDEQMVALYMYGVGASNSGIGFTRKGDNVIVKFSLLHSYFRDGEMQLEASDININGSIVEGVTMYSASKTNMSIIHSKISQFKYYSEHNLESTNFDISISFSKLYNSTWDISKFGNVMLEQIEIFNDFQFSIFFTNSIFISELYTRGVVRFYANFVGISGGIDIENSYFDSLTNFGISKHIFDITATAFLSLQSVVFSNNKTPLFGVSVCDELRIFNSQFIGNEGPCIYSDNDKGLNMRIGVFSGSKFVNNSCSDCSVGALFLRGIGFLGLSSSFVGNTATNGGACYISARTIGLTDSQFIDNRATSKGGALYFEPGSNEGSKDGVFNFECLNNMAQYSGGCYYSMTMKLGIELIDPILEGNRANSYGDIFGYPFFDVNYLIIITYGNGTISRGDNVSPELSLYAGQIISSIEITLWTNQTYRVSYLELPIEIEVDKSLVFLNYEQKKNSLNSTTRVENIYFSQLPVIPLQAMFTLQMKIENFNLSLTVTMLDCPSGSSLVQSVAQIGALTCILNPTIPYHIIIPVVSIITLVIVGVIAFCTLFIVRMTLIIVRKLKLLNRKLEAELKMESKLLQKRVALIEDDNEEQTINERSALLINSASSSKSNYRTLMENSSSWVISIDDIEILKKIAEGASGCIYLCDWKGTKVALKTLKDQMEVDNDNLFEQEAALLSTIRHPNIVQFFGIIFCSRKYIAVEYLEKGSLDKLIYNAKTGLINLNFTKKIEILFGVAKGMAYLHTMKPKPIIHRDLKPGNILLDNNLIPKICDFGLSRVWNNSFSNQSAPTTNVGTLFYMANEMITGGQYNHKVDIFSFGIIMWELFFEESPYINQNSPKLYKYGERDHNIDSHGFNALGKVLSGDRPVIPFHDKPTMKLWISDFLLENQSDDQILESAANAIILYVNLMKQCWDATPSERPEFSDIILTLSNMLDKVRELKI